MSAPQAAGILGFTNAWLWGDDKLSDMTLLLATSGGCDLGLLLLERLGVRCGVDALTLLHAEAKQAVVSRQAAEGPHAGKQAAAAAGNGIEPAAKRQRAEPATDPTEAMKQEASPHILAAEPEGTRITAHR